MLNAMSAMQFCAFDVETPNHHNDRISSIAIQVFSDSEIIVEKSYLVDPEAPFDSFNENLTKLNAETIAGSPTFPQVWDEISDYFYHSVVVAHNASFDLSVLRKCLSFYCIQPQPITYVCTLRCARKILPGLDNYQLSTLCDYYHIPLDHHQAGSDTSACAEILRRLLQQNPKAVNRLIAKSGASESDDQTDRPAPAAPAVRTRPKRKTSAVTQGIYDLQFIVSSIALNGAPTKYDVAALDNWAQAHQCFVGNYPYDAILLKLNNILADGFLTPDELDDLMDTLQSALDPLGDNTFCKDECISVGGKNIVLTGEFSWGSRTQLSKRLTDMGAVIQGTTTKKTDYVIVGGMGSDSWANQNYGNKVKKALELIDAGLNIQIIKECEFFDKFCVDELEAQQ